MRAGKLMMIAVGLALGIVGAVIAARQHRRSRVRKAQMTDRIKHCVKRAAHYRDEVLKEISKHPTADKSDRSLVATAFIKMAAGDFNGIISEIGNGNPGPAFKLFRLLYEDVVNGLWVQAFAPDDVIAKLLHTDHGQVSGTMAARAEKLDGVFLPPPTAGDDDKLFVDLQSMFWKAACSYTHGGSLAINREIAGYDEESTYEILRSSTTIFVMLMDAMYRLHHDKPNNVLMCIADTYFAEKW
jgi:hypothetical protein